LSLGFQITFFLAFLPCVLHATPIKSSLSNHPNIFNEGSKIRNFSCFSSLLLRTSYHSCPNILLSSQNVVSYSIRRWNSIFIHSFIHQWLYSPMLGPGLFLNLIIFFAQTVGLLGRGISPPQGRYLHTGQYKHRINSHIHPCLKWVSNTRSQVSSGRRHFML
jgi:hypothetical protein